MTESRNSFKRVLRRESVTLLLLVLVGIFLLPLAIYLVGADIFGEYVSGGFGSFYRDIHSDLREGQPVVIFLLISPYLVWQMLRLSFYTFRRLSPGRHRVRPQANPDKS
jgi:hypothetical protein